MKRLIPYLAFAFISGALATNYLPVFAGGCSSNINKKIINECAEEDKDCLSKNAEKLKLDNSVNS